MLFHSPAVAAEPADGVSLFDGKTFAGWEGNLKMLPHRGRRDRRRHARKSGSRATSFSAPTKEYGDFELRLKFKLLGKGVNAGVQFRTQRIPNHHEVSGYQADMGDGWWGCLYDESRRNKILAPADAKRRRQGAQARRLERLRHPLRGPAHPAVAQRPADRRLHREGRRDRPARASSACRSTAARRARPGTRT